MMKKNKKAVVLGGGGHFNLAACQLRDCSVSQAQNKLIETIMGELAPKED